MDQEKLNALLDEHLTAFNNISIRVNERGWEPPTPLAQAEATIIAALINKLEVRGTHQNLEGLEELDDRC